ncbi:MAG: histidine kinase [Chitinophagaceae bacterium]|nr:histidine kinase [Chitinophagaceae bacterium]
MKKLWRYTYPALFGLLIYATIRVVNDTVAEFRFWYRDWKISAIEIITCILMGYLLDFCFRKMFRKFDSKMHRTVGYKTVLYELLWVTILIEVVVNLVITPMVAFTDDGLSWGDFAIINIIPLLYCLIYYTVVRSNKLLQAYVNNRLQLEKVTTDQLQTELKFLKAQYHPHFLFNALNTIYFQMDENVSEAKRTIEKFSELLRYQLYDQQQTVPVSQEIEYLKNFIDIQKVRTSERLQLQTHFDTALNGQQVYPLLFLPLVENAFKYVGGDYRIDIRASGDARGIEFTVSNSLPPGPLSEKKNGIGLENLKRRLELLYPGKHELALQKDSNSFTAKLKLKTGT